MTGDRHTWRGAEISGRRPRKGWVTRREVGWILHMAYCNICILSLRFAVSDKIVTVLAAKFHYTQYLNELRLSYELNKVVQLGSITLGIHCY